MKPSSAPPLEFAAALLHETADTPPFTMRDALRQMWLADSYPILGNEDRHTSARMEAEALARADKAVAAPDDPPEFAVWIAALRSENAAPVTFWRSWPH